MGKPIIGLTIEGKREPDDARTLGSLTLNWNYTQAIADAGGVPIVIPPTADPETIAPLLDGWLIPGGNDIDAAEFGEANHPKAELQDPARYALESRLARAVDPEMPILGICYGCQFLNVVRGGSLDQHLPDRLGSDRHSGGTEAEVCLEPDSRLAGIAGAPSMKGRSYHHQGVARLGKGLKTVATHEDGTVEAIEAEDHPWLIGVQWHPERSLDDPATRRLFEAFVGAAAEFRRRRRD